MFDQDIRDISPIHRRLTFDEAHIVFMNIFQEGEPVPVPLSEFQSRLDNLLRHTPDSCLSGSICSLQEKVRHLSLAEYDQLCQDCISDKIRATENYALPSL